MNSELKELYNKYQITTDSLFEDNSVFSAVLSQIEGGHNEYTHFSRKLEKIIDLKWVDAIEKCIIPLDTIIRNPRKFIVQEEEIVPIEKARKISAESIRHLAQHTNMINSVKDGMVTPSKILNVFREESYDIYENRFIYTLLINVKNFIEKRYAVIFKLSGEENVNVIKMNSNAKIGKETVNYSIELNAKKTADSLDMDEESDVLLRIERIRRIIDEFLHSSFASQLIGCTPVRPPITRTNLITKDPNFKMCLDLWIFVESYTDVGYEINLIEKNEPVSDKYIGELNRLMAFNYLILKNNTDDVFDPSTAKKKRKLKPKFIKNFIEELVNDYDVTDDEVRRIFVDEITKFSNKRKAQEEKIDAAIARCLDSENARKAEIEAKRRAEAERRAEIERRKAERARIAKEKAEAKERARLEREAARKKAAEEREKEKVRLAKERLKAKEKAAKEKAVAAEKEKIAREKQRLKEKAAKEKAAILAKEKAERARKREKERLAKEKAEMLEKEKIKRAKQRERDKAAKEKAAALEKEKLAKAKQKSKEKAAREAAAAAEKARLVKERQKAREKAAKEKAAALAKEKLAREKQRAREKAAKEKAAAREKERAAREKQKAKEKAKLSRQSAAKK